MHCLVGAKHWLMPRLGLGVFLARLHDDTHVLIDALHLWCQIDSARVSGLAELPEHPVWKVDFMIRAVGTA